MHSKVLLAIESRPFIKEISGDSFTGRITVTLHEGFEFIEPGEDTAQRVFNSVRAAALGASRNTVKNLNAPEPKPRSPRKPRVNKEKLIEGSKVIDTVEEPYEFVGPLVDLDSKGRPLSMTPNAIRKRNAKAAKAVAMEA